MALVNVERQLDTYVSDVGQRTFTDIPLKFGADIPDSLITAMGYSERQQGACGIPLKFDKRALIATLSDGSSHRLPVGTIAEIPEKATALLALPEVVCVGLDGEQWGSIAPNVLAISYGFEVQVISADKKFIFVEADYTSDVSAETSQIIVRIEDTNEALKECSQELLENASIAPTGCGVSNLGFQPRYMQIKGRASDGNVANGAGNRKFARKAVASTIDNVNDDAQNVADCGDCLAYKGETVGNVELLLT